MIEKGKKVKFKYILKVNGKVLDSSFDENPMEYMHGEKCILPGLEAGLEGLSVGEEKSIIVKPEDGLGIKDERAFVEVPIENLPKDVTPKIGQMFVLKGRTGEKFPAKISEVREETVILDCNHPLAGKKLCFKVKILEIK